MSKLQILSVASEIYPFVKTGGLADVVGALPAALAPEDIAVTTLVPGYPAVMKALEGGEMIHIFHGLFGGDARLLKGRAGGHELFVIEAPYLFERAGNPYVGADGRDWHDNALRFAALARVAADLGLGLLPAFTPDILHLHDWQTGLAPAYMHYSGRPHVPSVMTVHNLAFQGKYPRELMAALGLPPGAFTYDGVEYYGSIGFLKAGLQFADRITTVSPTYATEIRTAEGGMGLDGLLRGRASIVSGILNGIDEDVWDPQADALIAATFSVADLEARAANKAALQAKLGLDPDPDKLLFGVVSRLTWQKGLDLLLERIGTLIGADAQLALLGSGEPWIASGFEQAAASHPESIGMVNGYDEPLAHLIEAGSDVLLVPSRFEPCGLTQLYALRYGAVPLVSRVGGLADTVIDANEMARAAGTGTGIQFGPVTGDHLEAAILRTAELWKDKAFWRTMQLNGMKTDVSWRRPAAAYARLFRALKASA